MSSNVDARLLDHWQESQRRQQAMRKHLGPSPLRTESLEGPALDLIADAFLTPPAVNRGRPSVARAAALMSDDR